MIRLEPDSPFADLDERARIRNEAKCGLREMEVAIMAVPTVGRVLELGCGTGYPMATPAALRRDLSFTGLEPLGSGFANFEAMPRRIEATYPDLTIHRTGIEAFRLAECAEPFDLVFSVNVFEHVDTWRIAVLVGAGLLTPEGRMVILCPNYAVPYEPHFRIPIFASPALTRRVLARHIARVEAESGSPGLCASLNFITVPAVRRHCAAHRLRVDFDTGVMARILERLDTEPEFARRQLSQRSPVCFAAWARGSLSAFRRPSAPR